MVVLKAREKLVAECMGMPFLNLENQLVSMQQHILIFLLQQIKVAYSQNTSKQSSDNASLIPFLRPSLIKSMHFQQAHNHTSLTLL